MLAGCINIHIIYIYYIIIFIIYIYTYYECDIWYLMLCVCSTIVCPLVRNWWCRLVILEASCIMHHRVLICFEIVNRSSQHTKTTTYFVDGCHCRHFRFGFVFARICGMKLTCPPICKTQTHCNMYIYIYTWIIYFNHHCVYLYIFIYLCTTCLMKLLNVWDQVAQDPTGMQLLAAVSVLTLYSDRAYLLSWYILLLMLDVSFCVGCLHLARFASTMQLLFVLKLHTLDVP